MTEDELAAVLRDAGSHHHRAFLETDGGDPEWPLWYAGWLQARLMDEFEIVPTRSLLCHLLVRAEREHTAAATDEPWPAFYARLLLPELDR